MIAYILGSVLIITLAWYAARDTAIKDAMHRHPAGKWEEQ
jgi:hypothetical protein